MKYFTNQCYIGVVILPKFLTIPPVNKTALSKIANKLSPDGLVSFDDIINGLCSSEYPFYVFKKVSKTSIACFKSPSKQNFSTYSSKSFSNTPPSKFVYLKPLSYIGLWDAVIQQPKALYESNLPYRVMNTPSLCEWNSK